MYGDRSYKFSFVAALAVHLLILAFLFAKIMSATRPLVMQESNIINAVVISQNMLDNKPAHPQQVEKQLEPMPQKVEPVIPAKPNAQAIQAQQVQKEEQAKAKLKAALKKRLFEEQSRELAEIKKQIQVKRKAAANLQAKKRQELLTKTLQQELSQEQSQLAAAHASNQAQGEINKYKAMIIQAISSQWIVPDGVDKGASCKLRVEVGPGGVVLNVVLLSSSGNQLLDRSAQTAVQKASPLPVPKETSLFDEFRVINLTVRPEGIVSG